VQACAEGEAREKRRETRRSPKARDLVRRDENRLHLLAPRDSAQEGAQDSVRRDENRLHLLAPRDSAQEGASPDLSSLERPPSAKKRFGAHASKRDESA